LASTEDFCTFTRYGVIFGPENKDVVLFPEQINGQYIAAAPTERLGRLRQA